MDVSQALQRPGFFSLEAVREEELAENEVRKRDLCGDGAWGRMAVKTWQGLGVGEVVWCTTCIDVQRGPGVGI
jgi:hypothetical protein